MTSDQVHVTIILAGLAFCVFLALMRWTFGPFSRDGSFFIDQLNMSLFYDAARNAWTTSYRGDETPWVTRARDALGKMRPPPRKFLELEGWSWRPIEGDPGMTVRVQDRSSDGRRLKGYIIGTTGTLQAVCRARTQLTLIEGWITLTTEDSPPMTLRSGDNVTIEAGFRGTWQNESFTHLNFTVTLP